MITVWQLVSFAWCTTALIWIFVNFVFIAGDLMRTSLGCCLNFRMYYNIWFVFHHKKSSSILHISCLLSRNMSYVSICLHKKTEECNTCSYQMINSNRPPLSAIRDLSRCMAIISRRFRFICSKDLFLNDLFFQSFVFDHVMNGILNTSYALNHIPTFLLSL